MASKVALTLTIVAFGCFTISTGHLNLYMNQTETQRLLGITAELYYVRNGIINNYALSFNLPIKFDVSDIYFTWQNLRPPIQGPDMYYKMAFTISKPRALHPPEPNISKEGIVPTELTAFRIKLACTGLATAEVDVHIQMNISIFSASNLTSLSIRRRKMCREDPLGGFGSTKKIVPSEHNVSYTFPQDIPSGGDFVTSTNIFYIAVGCACALILLIALIVAIYYIRSQQSTHGSERMSETSSTAGLHGGGAFLRTDTPNNSVVGGMSNIRRPFTPVTEMAASEVRTILGEIPIERSRISLGEALIEGTFGRIYTGLLLGDEDNEISAEQQVLIKTVTDQSRPDQVDKMLAESCLMKGMFHININPILGACLQDEKQPLLVFPHSNHGNLKKFLLKCKVSDIAHPTFSTQQLVYMAIQIIRGVQFLHRKRIIHRDIATRNCCLDSNLIIKVTDTALARDLFPNDYHCLGDNENRPVKWLAIEALLDRRFSAASEVWAFGVTLWELMTMAQQPYGDIDPFEMAAYIKDGYRIPQPIHCPDELFAVMACCWALNPDERPKLSQLLICLQDFYTALGRYI